MEDVERDKHIPSLWKANLVAFFIIFFVAFMAALWQTNYLSEIFLQEARDHAKLAAEIIKLNTQNTIEAKKTSSEIISSFLKSQIKFVKYLHKVEPFTPKELYAFSKEAGLAGITIMERNGKFKIESQKNWLRLNILHLCTSPAKLILVSNKKIYILNQPFSKKDDLCIVTGIDGTDILKIQKRIGLENTLNKISKLSGVKFVKIIPKKEFCTSKKCNRHQRGRQFKNCTELKDGKDGPVVEVRFNLGKEILLLGMDASALRAKQKNVWLLLLIFSVILITCGIIASMWLYRQQMKYLSRIRDYERRLYQKKHEASLGRSAATIAHEIRNPLNAVSMGIQRLILDDDISEKNKNILELLKNELARTEKIISGLLTYARPSRLKKRKIFLDEIIRKALITAQNRISCQNVRLQMKFFKNPRLKGDPDLLFQLFENLFINAFEALENHGELLIELDADTNWIKCKIINTGRIPSEKDLNRIFDPYFTTKTRGTGLGLAICKKIVKAHEGTIKAYINKNRFIIEVHLPGDK